MQQQATSLFFTRSPNLAWCVLAALACHGLIFFSLEIQSSGRASPKTPLSVTLYQEPKPQIVEEVVKPEPLSQEVMPEQVSPTPVPEQSADARVSPADVITAKATENQESRVSLSAVRQFIETDSHLHGDQNPNAVARFSNTFETEFEKDDSPKQLTRDMLPNDTGVFMATIDGQRRCGAKIIPMLSSGGLGDNQDVSILHKSCEPKQTFDLRLNKPRNPSMQ
ncbi:hypothetical protein GCM10008090_25110 [Arenicella chitinivorans]|uniref:Uncharacterized protein n=1 Tax=Arenicella chitinivorans TaxID=1329800 RepID=A0A918RX75_9GAMM|nr:hypothetical protein [Arenicella chitinivorans]GHA14313.1 hypothetical protein GCM10008090_25110 [Arenicella chitinivorans]